MTDLTADKLAIRELLEAYADAVIRKDADDWGATWTGDALWEIGGGTYEGREAIVARWASRVAAFDWIMFRVSVGRIDIAGDRATVRSYTAETFGKGDAPRREIFGRYDDELVRDGRDWRFQRRTFAIVA